MGKLAAAVIPVTAFEQNCTLLWDSETMEGIVIDPGGNTERIGKAIEELKVEVKKIVLTHGHIDHAGGAEALKRDLSVEIVGPHEADRNLLKSIEKQARMFGLANDVENVHPDRWLIDGEAIAVGGQEFEVLHCPGHTPGHIVLVNQAARFAHVGDVLFKGSIGRTDLPGGDHAALIASIKEKLLPLGDDISFISGHGPGSTFGEERRSNPFLS